MKKIFTRFGLISLGLAVILTLSMFVVAKAVLAQTPAEEQKAGEAKAEAAAPMDSAQKQAMVIAIAFMVGVGSMSAAYAVGKIGAASMGAASEKPELLGRALIFVGLAEGIAIYGLLVGVLLLFRL